MQTMQSKSPAKKQQGIALVFVLIMMSMVFVIAAVTSRISTVGERIARADRDNQLAYQSAEAALNDAEQDIMDVGTKRGCLFPDKVYADQGCSSDPDSRGYCETAQASAGKPIYKLVNFEDLSDSTRRYVLFGEKTGRQYTIQTGKNGVPAQQPKYIIEKTQLAGTLERDPVTNAPLPANGVSAYRVTAVGYGVSSNTQVLLQSVVVKQKLDTDCPSS